MKSHPPFELNVAWNEPYYVVTFRQQLGNTFDLILIFEANFKLICACRCVEVVVVFSVSKSFELRYAELLLVMPPPQLFKLSSLKLLGEFKCLNTGRTIYCLSYQHHLPVRFPYGRIRGYLSILR